MTLEYCCTFLNVASIRIRKEVNTMEYKMHLSPDISSLNRLAAHSPLFSYENEKQALSAGESSYKLSLTGEYEFYLHPNPESVDEFYRTDYVATPSKIIVPGNWETQGFDKPIYTNYIYPWSYETNEPQSIKPHANGNNRANPPYIPSDNPTGCYRKWFDLPKNFENRKTYIYFEGVETAYYLWINGNFVGYSQDSKLPSTFDISEFLQAGKNLLAVMVVRFADSTYLEDQDYWHISGIYRNVELISKPCISIEDYKVDAIPNLHYNSGEVNVDIRISRKDGFADYSVSAKLYDNNTLLVEDCASVNELADYTQEFIPTANTARVKLNAPKIELWDCENPKLYRLILSLYDTNNNLVDVESCNIGFKEVKIENGIVFLNGERLIVRGVNRHEHYLFGRSVPKEHMTEEIKQMKLMNINSVRTCHYPDSNAWYDLCDEYGILLVCECNLETHGVMGAISHMPSYAREYVDRAARMVQSHKNHTSIYSWSLGNESGYGANHAAMYGFIKEYDKYRLCQYEAGNPGKNISDIRGHMYAPIATIEDMLGNPTDIRPIILVEYLYQISNSGGGMDKFLELTNKFPRFQGGYIWDWQDKCLLNRTDDGTEYFAHGYDFGESYGESGEPEYMTNNGIVLADLKWKPVAYEVKQAYAPVRIDAIPRTNPWKNAHAALGEFTFVNDTQSLYGKDFICTAKIIENGIAIKTFDIELPNIKPKSTQTIEVALDYVKKFGCEYFIDFEIEYKNDNWYNEQNKSMSYTQYKLPGNIYKFCFPKTTAIITSSTNDEFITVSACDKTYVFSKTKGCIERITKGDIEYISPSLTPCFSRPRTGADCRKTWGWYDEYHIFDDSRTNFTFENFYCMDNLAVCTFSYKVEKADCELASGKIEYSITDNGVLDIDFSADVAPEVVSRVGLELILSEDFETLSYYARGENENYCDRILSAPIGIYNSTVTDEHNAFYPPSENGGHEDCRWLTLGENDREITITADKTFHFDVEHYKISDYDVLHEHKLPKRKEVYLHLDIAHSQIGGEMSWSTKLDERFNIGGRYHRAKFSLII